MSEQPASIRDNSLASATPLAAIDIGSNSFRLEIGQLTGGRYRRVDYIKESVRLGAGLDDKAFLTEEAVVRGLACLSRFAQRLAGFAATQVRAVATQTLREARNRDAFLLRAEAALGYPIEVVSGREEARLIFAGVARLQVSSVPRLVVDIGGRSTEMIVGVGRRPLRAESFRIGSVSLSMAYFPDGRFTEQAFRSGADRCGCRARGGVAALRAVAAGRKRSVRRARQARSRRCLIASGISDGVITPDGLRWLTQQCLRAGRADKLSLPGLKDDRRHVIGGGLAILTTLAAQFDIQRLQPARGALRQGVLFELNDRLQAGRPVGDGSAAGEDIRDSSVRELQERFDVDLEQATRVGAVASALYDGAFPTMSGVAPCEPRAEARCELLWAAALHEIGMSLSHHDHHRHSAYMLSHADAAGFSQSQQRRLGELLLAQRGGLRKVELQLAEPSFAWQALCLRLAVIKCHARRGVDASALQLQRSGEQAVLSLAPGWAERNPRTMFLLEAEAVSWERNGPLRLLIAR